MDVTSGSRLRSIRFSEQDGEIIRIAGFIIGNLHLIAPPWTFFIKLSYSKSINSGIEERYLFLASRLPYSVGHGKNEDAWSLENSPIKNE